MRIFVNNHPDGLAAIAACYADILDIGKRLGMTQTHGLAKGGGRDVDDYIAGCNAAVIVETDDGVLGFGAM